MATGNFKSMDKFPLIVAKDIYTKVCPDCGLTMDGEADKCECGCDLADVEANADYWMNDERVTEMNKVADELNAAQKFFKVTVESGYYEHVQFYVEENYWDVENWDNDDAQNEFGICRSEMLRRYKVAENTVVRGLRKAAKQYGYDEIAICARFSNGETWYSKVA